jgi:HlyD family secretion protein
VSDPKKLFRKAALDKMASPERLDEMMEVTAPAGWVALLALGLVLVGAVVWGIVGSIPIKVQGQGILLRGEAVLDVTAASGGRIAEIAVGPGDVVEAGDVVAKVAQPDLALRIQNTEEELQSLLGQSEEQKTSSGRIVAQLEQQRRDLREKVGTQQEMVSRGLVTRGTLLATQSQLASIEQQIAQLQVTGDARGNRIDDVRRALVQLQNQLAASSEVTSPYHGRVLELMVDPGNLVAPGTRLLNLEALDGTIDTVVYVPAAEGKKIRKGMQARISPSTVRPEEFGFMLGEVKSVSEYPVTAEGMVRVLRNDQLVQGLTGKGGPLLEVVVDLEEDPTTPSGFAWSSSQGPPTEVYTGTIADAQVIVERRKPISYVLPIFKDVTGDD